MSVLDDFARMRLYRGRASEFELLAETEDSRDVRLRYRIIARHRSDTRAVDTWSWAACAVVFGLL